jgi:hypothetical protein
LFAPDPNGQKFFGSFFQKRTRKRPSFFEKKEAKKLFPLGFVQLRRILIVAGAS